MVDPIAILIALGAVWGILTLVRGINARLDQRAERRGWQAHPRWGDWQ